MFNTVWLSRHPLKEDLRQEVVSALLEQHHAHDYPPEDNNIALTGPFVQFCSALLRNRAAHILGDYRSTPDPRTEDGWAYIMNRHNYRGTNIHTHSNTCTLTGVYYLSVPSHDDPDNGAIDFWDNTDTLLGTHRPQQDDFLVFPAHLRHSIRCNDSDEYRISINVELRAEPTFQIIQD